MKFLFKSTHYSWRYKTKCEWVFFPEHSVDHKPTDKQVSNTSLWSW